MVERVETPTTISFNASPESDFPVVDMSDTVKANVDTWIDETISRNPIKWDSALGHGGFYGLNEKLTAKFEPAAPKCDPQTCRMHIEVMASSGRAADAVLSLVCPRITEQDK